MKKEVICQKLKYLSSAISVFAMTFAFNPVAVFAEGDSGSSGTGGGGGELDFSGAATPVVQLINSLLGPIISIVVAVGAIYCVILGVKLAKADEPQEREKAKMALKNAIIGFFLIFILIVVMRLMVPSLVGWINTNKGNMTEVNVTYQ